MIRETRGKLLSAALGAAAVFGLAHPGGAAGRLLFGFLPAEAGPAGELRADLLARLERTGRYALVDLPLASRTPFKEACGSEPYPDKIARVEVGAREKEKFRGALVVFDCATNTLDPLRVEASSGKLSNLASSLRGDFIAAYPFLTALEKDGGALWVPAGPKEKIEPGGSLYGYLESSPRAYRLVRKLRVANYHEAAFRSELVELWRIPGAAEPAPGEILSPEPLATLAPRALSAPVLSRLFAARRIAAGAEVVLRSGNAPAPSFGPGEARALGEGEHALELPPQAVPPGSGASLAFEFLAADAAGWAVLLRRGEGGAYEIALTGGEILARFLPRNDAAATLARAPLSLPPGWHSLRLVAYGAWTEAYVDGRFALGFEAYESDGGTLALRVPPAGLEVRDPSLFELRPAAENAPSRRAGVSP